MSIFEQAIDRVFTRALELSGEERSAWLDQSCAGDPELRSAVEEMLRDGEATDPLFDAVEENYNRHLEAAEALLRDDQVGRSIGPWRIEREIGRGGMGVVYLARRADGAYEQKAALKMVRVDGRRDRRERFLRERRILAGLEHPGIARLLDGGWTQDGRPYLAMEYVDGLPIDAFCLRENLSGEKRLRLFVDVCRAVGAAHQSLVVHRDLKPSNILVARIAGRPTVKLLDFGIAKLLETGPDESTLTSDRARVMTPAFASPEQFCGRTIGIASDVYQLGLLLYRLLTDRSPYDFDSSSSTQVRQMICEIDAPLPSTMVQGSQRRRLRGDLDNIVGKALRKEPEERYRSVDALADDLERHLDGLPVAARSPTFSYRATRLIKRHPAASSTTAIGLLLVFLLTIAHTRRLQTERDRAEQARIEAEQARDEAQQLTDYLVDLFKISDPERDPDDPVDARALLKKATDDLEENFADQPLTKARLQMSLSEIYRNLAFLDQAAALAQGALETRRGVLDPEHPDLLKSLDHLGAVYSRQKDFDRAEPLLREAVAALKRSGRRKETAEALNSLANLRWRQRRLEEAETLHREALAIRREEFDPVSPEIAATLNNLGVVLQFQAEYEEGVDVLERAAALYEKLYGLDHPQRVAALNNLSVMETSLMRWPQAEQHLREVIASWTMTYGPVHPYTLRARQNLGVLYLNQIDPEQGVPLMRAVLRDQRTAPEPEPDEIARTLSLLGRHLTLAGEPEEAAAILDEALTLRESALGADHPLAAATHHYRGDLLRTSGNLAEAEETYRSVLQIKAKHYPDDHLSIAQTRNDLGIVLLRRGRSEEAGDLLRLALSAREAKMHPDDPHLAVTLLALGEIAESIEQADAYRRRALDIRRRMFADDHPLVREARRALKRRSPESPI